MPVKVKKAKRKKVLAAVLSAAIILAAAAAAFLSPSGSMVPDGYADGITDGVWDSVDAADWMGSADGGLKLSEISIPGSHDSCTQYVVMPLIGRCQDSSIASQLNMGVRVLDIRLNTHDDGSGGVTLTISHGFLGCKAEKSLLGADLTFASVVEQCSDFLKAHPTETVVLLVKHEHGDATAQQLENAIYKVFGSSSDVYDENRIPTLDEVRGSLVLARRYGADGDSLKGLDFRWEDQGGEGVSGVPYISRQTSGGFELCVQDRYEYELQDKLDAATYCIDSSPAGEETFLLNYLSTKGSGKVGVPKKYASAINPWFAENELLGSKDYGCVMFDFVNAGLARHVFSANTLKR